MMLLAPPTALLAKKIDLGLRVYVLLGDGGTSPSQNFWRAIEHRRVSYNVLTTKDCLWLLFLSIRASID